MYTVKLWKNSGYNSIDRPDTRALLGEPTYTKQAVSIVQDRDLPQVSLRGTWKEFRDIDYVSIQDNEEEWYYSVITKQMSSPDICIFALKTDYCLSVGLFENNIINNIEGITERYCVKDDSFGKYIEQDNMLQPQQSLEMTDYKIISTPYITQSIDPSIGDKIGDAKNITLIESTVDLLELIKTENSAITYSDSQGREVTVPVVKPITDGKTDIGIDMSYYGGVVKDGTVFELPYMEGVKFYDARFPEVQQAITICRSLGVESSIIKQYSIPQYYIHFIQYKPKDASVQGYQFIGPYYGSEKPGIFGDYRPGRFYQKDVDYRNTEGEIEKIYGVMWNIGEGEKFIYDPDIKNNKVLYERNLNNYVLMSSAGNSVKFNPDEIIPEGEINNETKPQIWTISDIRPDSFPIFRFQYYLKQGPSNDENRCNPSLLIRNSIKGCQWHETPLIFTGLSNSEQIRENFEGEQILHNVNYEMGKLSDITNIGTGLISGALTGNPSSVLNLPNNLINMESKRLQNEIERRNDLYNFAYRQQVVSPSVNFPFLTNFLRDITCNAIISYKIRPSLNDRKRFDRILTMYGYRATDYIQPWMFNCRENFNFIKADNITIVGTDLPNSIKTGVVNELSAGVRFWHKTPNQEYFKNNPIKEEI